MVATGAAGATGAAITTAERGDTGKGREGEAGATIEAGALALADGWAGDLAWSGGALWVAWAACLDGEVDLLSPAVWEWPLRREAALRPGATVDQWRALEVPFAIRLGRVDHVRSPNPEVYRGDGKEHGGATLRLAEEREVGRSAHAVEGPALAPLAGGEGPVVVWAERRHGKSALLASIGGGPAEVVVERAGAILGPRVAATGDGSVWVAWQQWPDQAMGPDAPQILVASRGAGQRTEPPGTPERPAAWSAPQALSPDGQPAWAPALAVGPDGGRWCAWDAWDGAGYHVFVRHAPPGGEWQPAAQVSAPGARFFHSGVDVAAEVGCAWLVWSRTLRWGETNHRFNHLRSLHAAKVTLDGDSLTIDPAPAAAAFGEPGELPVPSIAFSHTVEEEFVNPATPRIVAGAGGPTVFYRQFRSAAFKDFGWALGATTCVGGQWTPPAVVSTRSGFPDTPYGLAPAAPGGTAGAEASTTWLVARHVGEYPRYADRHPSRPVAQHRLAVERVAVPAGDARDRSLPSVEAAPRRAHGPVAPVGRPSMPPEPRERPEARRVEFAGRTYKLLYGDLHRHSAYSKCMSANDGDPLDHWRWAQDVAGLDFYAITEHLEYLSYVEWRRIEDLAERLAAGGQVLALCGFELAIPPGHTNFFYADQRVGRDLRVACLSSADLAAVWPKLDDWVPRGTVVAIRHHQGHRGDVASTYAPAWEPLAEVVQTRGEFPAWVQSLWRQGFRVGVAGASDHSRGAPFVQALTGAWLPPAERSREGVLAALSARRTFATNGVRLSVFLSAHGPAGQPALAMGEAGEIDGAPRLRVAAHGTTPLETVEFYRGERLLAVQPVEPPGTLSAELEYEDAAPPPGEHAYWVRVAQGPEHSGRRPHRGVAYSSPVWISVA